MPCRRLEAASVHRQTQFEIYLNRVAATLLQGIRPKFVHQTDSASLLAAQTDDGAEARCCHVAQCGAQLPATVASARPKDITGEALGMNANRHVPSSGEIPPRINTACSWPSAERNTCISKSPNAVGILAEAKRRTAVAQARATVIQ